MRQTAVEFIVYKLTPSNWTKEQMQEHYKDAIEQAKEMEKEQKIKFAEHCLDKALDLDIRTAFANVEQYYNEKFKS